MMQLKGPLFQRRCRMTALLLLMALWPAITWAQLADRYGLVDDFASAGETGAIAGVRFPRGSAPVGVRVGSFILQPEASATAGFDDNVLGTKQARGSAFEQTQAVLQAGSDWSRNSILARLSVSDLRYLDQPRQSYTDWTATLGGSYEIGRDTASLRYMHQNLIQTPRDLNTPQLDAPIAYRVDNLRATYDARFNRLTLRPGLDVSVYSYDDGRVAGQPYLQTYRNRTVLTPGLVAAYELAPQRELIGIVQNGVASFRNPVPGALLLDYNDALALGGIDYDGGGLWRIRALAGYEVRSFSSPLLKSIQAPVAELTVIVRPTRLTTVTGVVSRRITDSADETTTGVTKTSAQLTVDHEYLRNVLLKATGGISYDSYGRGQGEQILFTAGAGATWLINRAVRLTATYDFKVRQSHISALLGDAAQPSVGQPFGGSYSSNRYGLQISIGL